MTEMAAAEPARQPWRTLRDRLLTSPRFQRLARAFPLTRPLVRHYERQLFDLVAGFTYSQVLAAVVQLKVLDLLAEAPRSADELSPHLGLAPGAAATLLDAATALRLVERDAAGRYAPGLLGTVLRTQPGVQAMVEHHALLYADLADPVALLRGQTRPTALGRYWTYSGNPAAAQLTPAQVASYSTLMSVTQQLIAGEILDAYPVGRHRCLLDVGGGEGSFLRAAAARAPQLRLMLYDLPAVVARAQAGFAAAGLAGRAQCFAGDFRGAELAAQRRPARRADPRRRLRRGHAATHPYPVAGRPADRAPAGSGLSVVDKRRSGLVCRCSKQEKTLCVKKT